MSEREKRFDAACIVPAVTGEYSLFVCNIPDIFVAAFCAGIGSVVMGRNIVEFYRECHGKTPRWDNASGENISD